MKTTFKNLFLLVLVTMLFVSCNTEELFVDPITQAGEEDTEINDEDTEVIVEEVISTPCDFSLDNVEPNSTITINCVLDLEGSIVNLPAGVVIVYEGGDIINGMLNFSDNSIISGELLNSSLTLGGATPQLKDPIFNFIGERWSIIEGEVPQDVAFNNRIIIRELVDLCYSMGATTFKLDSIDAYFYMSNFGEYLFDLPSDFNLEMTQNTHLRVYLNSVNVSLIRIRAEQNVKVSGGFLRGYRDIAGNNDDSGFDHLISITSGQNVVIENVHMSMATEGQEKAKEYSKTKFP